jgi:hypothetical protein
MSCGSWFDTVPHCQTGVNWWSTPSPHQMSKIVPVLRPLRGMPEAKSERRLNWDDSILPWGVKRKVSGSQWKSKVRRQNAELAARTRDVRDGGVASFRFSQEVKWKDPILSPQGRLRT